MVGCPLHITQGHSSLKPQNLARATTWPFPRGLFARFSKFCFNGSHWPYMCRLSLGSQWGAPTGHIGCMLKSPPATGRPGWRSGNARARCTGLRTSLDGCAAHPQCSRGWCCARSTPQPSAQTAGAASTIATGRRRVAGCDVHVSHICARALAAQPHVHAMPLHYYSLSLTSTAKR